MQNSPAAYTKLLCTIMANWTLVQHYGELNYCAPYSGELNYCAPYSCSPNYFVPYSCASNYCCNLVKLHTPNYCAPLWWTELLCSKLLCTKLMCTKLPVKCRTLQLDQKCSEDPSLLRCAASLDSSLLGSFRFLGPRPSICLFFTIFNFLIFP